jgi:hypothetical protein
LNEATDCKKKETNSKQDDLNQQHASSFDLRKD